MKPTPIALAAASVLSTVASAQSDLHLTEFLAKNESVLPDEDGDFSDWIEIHNATASPIDLAGWGLTDDDTDLFKWAFPGESLGPGEYLVVFASDKNRAVKGAELHTNFKLSGGGEYLALVRPDASIATEYAPEFPGQSDDVSYGLEPGFVTRAFFDPPTPGAPNIAVPQPLAPLESSVPHGLHTAAFDVDISHPDPAAMIHFTLDGREPEPTDPVLSGPLSVDATTILRARAFAAGALPSPILSVTWVFPADIESQSEADALLRGMPADWIQLNGEEWSFGGLRPGSWYGVVTSIITAAGANATQNALQSLPVVSIQMHPDDWFGHQAPSGRDGIYVNSEEEGGAWERAASLEWIDPTGGPGFTIDCGTNIQGGTSTGRLRRSQLSMAMKFKSEYGPTKLEYDLFPGSGVDRFDYIVLDAGNQLSVNEPTSLPRKIHAQETRDQFMADLHGRMGHLNPSGHHAHVLINGMYWGVYWIHERPDERFAAEHMGGDEEEYDWVKTGVVLEGNDGAVGSPTPGLWREVVDIVSGGLAAGTVWNGQEAYDALLSRVDIVNYVDYLLANWYGGNRDWPHNNWMATARARTSANFADVNPAGKFRFHAWDAESVLFWGPEAEVVGDGDYDRTGVRSGLSTNVMFIHTEALAHPDYVQLVRDRAHFHLETPDGAFWVEPGFDIPGTQFDPSFPERNVPASLYHAIADPLAAAITTEYARWGTYWPASATTTPADWHAERARIMAQYFPIRSAVLTKQLLAGSPHLLSTIAMPTADRSSGLYPGAIPMRIRHPHQVDVYYTIDGSDPRAPGGQVAPTAQLSATSFTLPRGLFVVRARAFDGTEWSPMLERTWGIGLDIVINEVQADNGGTIADGAGEFDDWFEIQNKSNEPVQVSGLFVSDDPGNPFKHELGPGLVVPARGQLLLWADEDLGQGAQHVDFKLSAKGESVGLYAPAEIGAAIDEVEFGPQLTDNVTARFPNGIGPFRTLFSPSPGANNALAPISGSSSLQGH